MNEIDMIRNKLKRLSTIIDEQNIHVSLEPNDCPFVDKACERIVEGGDVDHICLASLLHLVAENLES